MGSSAEIARLEDELAALRKSTGLASGISSLAIGDTDIGKGLDLSSDSGFGQVTFGDMAGLAGAGWDIYNDYQNRKLAKAGFNANLQNAKQHNYMNALAYNNKMGANQRTIDSMEGRGGYDNSHLDGLAAYQTAQAGSPNGMQSEKYKLPAQV